MNQGSKLIKWIKNELIEFGTYAHIINIEKSYLRQYLGDFVDSDELKFLYTDDFKVTHSRKIFPFSHHHQFTYLQKLVLMTKKYPEIIQYLKLRSPHSTKLESKCGNLYLYQDEQFFSQLTVLHLACIYADTLVRSECIDILIDAGSNIDAQDNLGRSALQLAITYGSEIRHTLSLGVIKKVLGAGINVDLIDNSGSTALHELIKNMISPKHKKAFDIIMKTRPNINLRDNNGWTPLHLVAICANCSNLSYHPKLIIKAIGENNFLRNKVTPETKTEVIKIIKADKPFEFDYLHIIMKLLEAGADPNIKDYFGLTPLHYAVTLSAFTSNIDIVEILLKAGANSKERSIYGYTSLHYAAIYSGRLGFGNSDTIRLLLEHDSDCVNLVDSTNSIPLHYTCYFSHPNSTKEVEKMLTCGANVNQVNLNGNTPLFVAVTFAASESSLNIIKLLIEAGASLSTNGNNALDIAIKYCQTTSTFEVLEFLLDVTLICNQEYITANFYEKQNATIRKVIKNKINNLIIDQLKPGECYLCLDECPVIRCKHDHGICYDCMNTNTGKFSKNSDNFKICGFCGICNCLFIN
jgi:ankyrin repeat protein